MLSALSSAVCACAWRRVRSVLARNPLVAVMAASVVPAVPIGAGVAGARLASRFADVAVAEPFAAALALAVGAGGAVAGITIALAAPSPRALGPQIVAAPVRRATLAAGGVVLPVLTLAAFAAVPALAFAVALAGAPGGVLVAAFAACALLGAALAEACRLAAAGSWIAVPACAAAAVVWAAAAAGSGGSVAAGPAAAADAVLRGRAPVGPLVSLAAALVSAAALWTLACATPRRERATRRDVAVPRAVPRVPVLAPRAAFARATIRRRELRSAAVAAVAIPVLAAAAFRVAFGVVGEPLLVFAAGLTLVTSALFPPAAQGLALEARWLTAAAPVRAALVRAAAAAAGVGVAFVVVGATVVTLGPLARGGGATLLELEATLALVAGTATATGAFVPWRPDRVLEQFAAFVVAGAATVVVGSAAAQLVGGSAAAGVAVGNLVLGLGILIAAAAGR